MPQCAACAQENPDIARYCLACGAALLDADVLEARRTVTVLFADLVDSTTLAERHDAETYRSFLTRYYAVSRAAIERHGGTVEKYAGDAVMAVFGLRAAHEDDALRALRAAIEIRTAVAELPADLGASVHIGVNTGEVVVGAGDGVLATGDAVNVAARLEEAAGRDEILVGAPTYRLVRDVVRAEQLPPLALKGKSERVGAVRLVDLAPDPQPVRLASPLVGRTEELALLATAFESAVRERRCKIVTVIGAAGVGKSRLVREFAAARVDDARVLRGRCLPYGDGITFWPVKELVAEAAGLVSEEPAEAAQAKVGALLEPGPERAAIAARVAEVAGLADTDSGLAERFWGVRRLFETLARREPLIVVLDDVQWAEPTMAELVAHVAHAHDAPLVLLCLARPELLDVYPRWVELGETLHVEPLATAETVTLVGHLAAGAPADLFARVADVAEGNPLFAEELVRVLVDERALVRRDGAWRLDRDVAEVRVPPTIHALLAARLDLLEAIERRVLSSASVEGRVFHRGAAERLAAVERPALTAALRSLAAKQLVRPDEPRFEGEHAFRFHHLLVRDVAYESVRKEERADLHERFAEWLDEKAGERASEYDEIVGYHLEQSHHYRAQLGAPSAGVGERAAARLAPAGLRAHARGDIPAAATLLSRAIELLPGDAPERAALAPKLEEALLEQRTAPGRFDGRTLRCFWSWRWGHTWIAAEHRGLRVLRCTGCGKERRRTKGDRPLYDAEAKLFQTSGWPPGGGS